MVKHEWVEGLKRVLTRIEDERDTESTSLSVAPSLDEEWEGYDSITVTVFRDRVTSVDGPVRTEYVEVEVRSPERDMLVMCVDMEYGTRDGPSLSNLDFSPSEKYPYRDERDLYDFFETIVL